ncbi:MAG TPA: diaminopimelate epimerase [Fimbriimonas sp.]|nr:diaminopimelate epimerase [Fimbriimonas sp.]
MNLKFTKAHGIGNDFVVIDTIRDGVPDVDMSKLSKLACDRRTGVGADGIILILRKSELEMRMFNPDGSESEMCGNGLRAFAKICVDRGYASGTFEVKTGAGQLTPTVLPDGRVSVNMGQARLNPSEIGMKSAEAKFINAPLDKNRSGTAVSMGNPHLMIFVDEVNAVELEYEGPLYEHHALFPNRTNVHFVQVLNTSEVKMRSWERGAGATLACGTGACAVAVAAHENGFANRQVTVHLPGGDLEIDYQADGTVIMTGSATTVFEGELGSALQPVI